MKCGDYESPAFALHNVPYSSSLATSASASSTSVWSDASSQHSDDTSLSIPTSEPDSCDVFSRPQPSEGLCAWSKQQTQPQSDVSTELRQNPRRTSHSATSRTGCPPSLVRQADRKVNFVDNLVDSSTHIVEAIWPTSSVVCHNEHGGGVLPLRTFIQETLRRSRSSYSTLQVALYYLVLIKPRVPTRDFTMEQMDDCYATRALQCGRRMFLAALILASKYLQDRNYSARAWSKISGLNTQEINQNEMAFLLAVNWKLHITETVYNRWTDCVMKFTPPQPPSPGGNVRQYERQCEDFRKIILNLNSELDNLEEVLPESPMAIPTLLREVPARTLFTPSNERTSAFSGCESDFGTPVVMEPSPTAVYTPGRVAPALGLLPTPRLTPQSSGFSTPAVNAASYLLGKTSSMGFAMAQAGSINAAQALDRFPTSVTSSPQCYVTTRRSSLANSVSTASSPESMISDTSRTSRSSSISSASSLMCAPSSKLDVQARCRYAKLCGERLSLRPTIASVPEDYEENCISSSPESYSVPVAKDMCELSMETPFAQREREIDDAARALQELQHYRPSAPLPAKAGCKRSRALSTDNNLQDNVRDMLTGRRGGEAAWKDTLVRPRLPASGYLQVPVRAPVQGCRKRVCCSTEAAQQYIPSLHTAMSGGIGGPGMWEGILN